MKEKKSSYPLIHASQKTIQVLKLIAKQQAGLTPTEIADRMDLKYATVMTHLVTLEREGLIEEIDTGYIGSLELATFWAMRKAMITTKEQELEKEKEILGIFTAPIDLSS